MNSSELQKRHAKVYEDFFVNNTIVVSSPFLINRSGDIHPDFSWVSIKQKIPLRLYIWVHQNTLWEHTLWQTFSYDYLADNFEKYEWENYAIYWSWLLEEIKKLIWKKSWWLTINILSEIPRTLWLWYNSILSLCLGVIITFMNDKNSFEEMIALPKGHIQNSLKNSNILNNLLYTSMKLDSVINWKMWVSLKISSFFDWYYPIVSFKDKSQHIIEYGELSTINFYGLRMDEIRENLEDVSFPFDFWIIISDKPILRENLKNINHTSNISIEEINYLKTIFDKILPENRKSFEKMPKFYRFLDNTQDSIYNVYGSMMWAISMETLNAFGKIISSHYSDDILWVFFSTINKIRYGNNIVRRSSSHFLWFIDSLLSMINLPSSEFAVFPNDTLIMWWTLTYASYSVKNRNIINTAVEKIKALHIWAGLLYSNFSDGIANKWLIVEQHIEKGLISKHLISNSWELEDYMGKKMVGDFNYLIHKKEYDLILDVFNGKIYHKGEKLTSHDLSSQSTTIELIKLLFSSSNKEIYNRDMSYSSYSKNKNEMSSKIIVPLERRVKEAIWKDCVIRATWSLTEYSIYIKHNTLKIAFLDKKKF